MTPTMLGSILGVQVMLASQYQGQQVVIPYHAVLAFLQADQRDLLRTDQTPDRDLGIDTEPRA